MIEKGLDMVMANVRKRIAASASPSASPAPDETANGDRMDVDHDQDGESDEERSSTSTSAQPIPDTAVDSREIIEPTPKLATRANGRKSIKDSMKPRQETSPKKSIGRKDVAPDDVTNRSPISQKEPPTPARAPLDDFGSASTTEVERSGDSDSESAPKPNPAGSSVRLGVDARKPLASDTESDSDSASDNANKTITARRYTASSPARPSLNSAPSLRNIAGSSKVLFSSPREMRRPPFPSSLPAKLISDVIAESSSSSSSSDSSENEDEEGVLRIPKSKRAGGSRPRRSLADHFNRFFGTQ